MKLLITDTFPTIELTTTTGTITLPNEFAGHWLVFFSHPGDFTPVCTTEFVGFQKRAEQFAALDTKLIGPASTTSMTITHGSSGSATISMSGSSSRSSTTRARRSHSNSGCSERTRPSR